MIKIKEIKTENGKTEMSSVTIQGTAKSICEDVIGIMSAITNSLADDLKKQTKVMLSMWLMFEADHDGLRVWVENLQKEEAES